MVIVSKTHIYKYFSKHFSRGLSFILQLWSWIHSELKFWLALYTSFRYHFYSYFTLKFSWDIFSLHILQLFYSCFLVDIEATISFIVLLISSIYLDALFKNPTSTYITILLFLYGIYFFYYINILVILILNTSIPMWIPLIFFAAVAFSSFFLIFSYDL